MTDFIAKLSQLYADNVNWRSITGTVEDLVDGGYDITIKPGDLIAKSPWIDVRAFGAVGDGTTDDSPAIQSAIDSLGSSGGLIFFPPGDYLLNSALTSDYSYRGFIGVPGLSTQLIAGFDGTLLNLNASASADASHGVNYLYVSDILFNGNSKSAIAISALDVSKSRISNCRFMNFTGTSGAIYLCHRDNFFIDDCTFYLNDYSVVVPNYLTANYPPQTWAIRGCHFAAPQKWAVYITSSTADFWVSNCSFALNSSGVVGAIYFVTGTTVPLQVSQNIIIRDSTFEGAAVGSLKYVWANDANTRTLSKLTIDSCNFLNGKNYAVTVERTTSPTISNCKSSQTATDGGRFWSFDANCTEVMLSHNRESTDVSVCVDSTSDEISVEPSVVFYKTRKTSASYWGADVSSVGVVAETEIDVPTEFSITLPQPLPKAWIFNVRVLDSLASTAAVNESYFVLQEVAGVDNGYPRLVLEGGLNSATLGQQVFVPAKSAAPGKVYMRRESKGVMTLYLALWGYLR